MIKYRVVTYFCGCSYLWLYNTKRSPKCPEHGNVQVKITLWCRECNKKIITTPLAGRRKRCHECSSHQQNKRMNKRAQQTYNEKHGIKEEATAETLREKEERETDVWYQECRKWLNLAAPATPILDNYLGR